MSETISANNTEFQIRDLDFADEAEVLKVSELYIAVPLSWDPAWTYSQESIHKKREWFLEKRDTLKCLLVLAANNIVGLHLLRMQGPETCLIHTLWIEEKYRGMGLGSRLKAAGEGWAQSQGAKKMVTYVFLDNPKMIAINEAKGFKKVKVELHKDI